jgi:hypothetical protein
MGRVYVATFKLVAATAAQDLFEINAPADCAVILHGFGVSQSSDAGDAASEMLNVLIHRGSTSGSGGSTLTPAPLHLGDAAFGGTVESNNTTQSTEGTLLGSWDFHIAAGLQVVFTPETRPVISPSARLIIELQSTPTDSLTISGYAFFEEIGG